MPRAPVNNNNRLALHIQTEDKELIQKAVVLAKTDMTEFILSTALREAQLIINKHEHVNLSARDSRRVLKILENPPAPNAKLRKAAKAMPKLP